MPTTSCNVELWACSVCGEKRAYGYAGMTQQPRLVMLDCAVCKQLRPHEYTGRIQTVKWHNYSPEAKKEAVCR